MKDLFWKIKIKADENKNERNDIEKWEKKIKQKDLKFETIIYIYILLYYIHIYIYIYIYLIFNNLRQQDILLIVFIMVKLI